MTNYEAHIVKLNASGNALIDPDSGHRLSTATLKLVVLPVISLPFFYSLLHNNLTKPIGDL